MNATKAEATRAARQRLAACMHACFQYQGARARGRLLNGERVDDARSRTNITAGNKVAHLIAAAAAEGVTLASSVAVGVGWLGAKLGHF